MSGEHLWVRSASGRWDGFCETVGSFIEQNVSEFAAEGERVRGYRSPDTKSIWIRDHTHQMKAAKYTDPDLKGTLDFFVKRQREDGGFWEKVDPLGRLGRIECEADVEYHFVRAVYLAWQATGDGDWMAAKLDALERGLRHCMTSPARWSAEHGLIKRPFTIDTWDFQYLGPAWTGRYTSQIGPHSRFGIMHGDNSGFYESCRFLAAMLREAGQAGRADAWEETADGVRERMNKVCWGGAWYRHAVHIDPVEVPEVDEERQLSLSNTYDINRGAATHGMAVSILDEYARRAKEVQPRPFAEWFSIEPCFWGKCFGSFPHQFGERRYINGSLMPLVGGELARAALEHGREAYGVAQLAKYADMVKRTGQAYLCYHYDGTPDLYRDTITPHDGWGSAAMVYGLVEGLAGVADLATRLDRVRLSPRWTAAGEAWAEARVGYAASGAWVRYRYEHDPAARELRLSLDGSDPKQRRVEVHLLLPKGAEARGAEFRGRALAFTRSKVEESVYVDFGLTEGAGEVVVGYDGPC